jgi:hypothetical protein
VFEWARQRGLDRVVGPKGFGVLDGYGILVDGYEHRQMMTMMNYNAPYYARLVESNGFEKEVDFVSCYLNADSFRLPERVHHIAARVQERGTLQVQRFRTKGDLKAWAKRIGQAYNNAFVNNWEYYPLTENEIAFLLQNLLTVADPRLIKVITHNEDAVGFLFGFPDVSAALQRAKGHLRFERRRNRARIPGTRRKRLALFRDGKDDPGLSLSARRPDPGRRDGCPDA